MNFERVKSKSGEDTLIANGRYIYSKYAPLKDASKFIEAEVDFKATGYILLGLGLGYHLKALVDIVEQNKPIYVMYIDSQEMNLFDDAIKGQIKEQNDNVKICENYEDLEIREGFQVIIPNCWLQLMNREHPLYWEFADLKMKQVSYKRFKEQMEKNWTENIKLQEFNLAEIMKIGFMHKTVGCLISSGPSLSDYKHWLKERDDLFVLCVGSALASLVEANIKPDAVIITDAQNSIKWQFEQMNYTGVLFYLSTASHAAVQVNEHAKRCILLQEGYPENNEMARCYNYPLLVTGGSVATVGFSLLQYFGFEKIVLFGQDLCIQGTKTHDINSTSGREINEKDDLIKVESNNGSIVQSLPNLYSYLKWFENRLKNHNGIVYNTAKGGALIKGTDLLNNVEEFKRL